MILGSHHHLTPQPRPGFSIRPGTRQVLGTKAQELSFPRGEGQV